MSVITITEIEKLASLARLALTEDEKKSLQTDISSILTYIDQIKNAVSNDQTLTVSSGSINVFREDTSSHESGTFTEELLSAAPQREDNYFKVKKIL